MDNFWYQINSAVKTLSRREIFGFFVFLFLIVSLPLSVIALRYQAQYQRSYQRSKATEVPTPIPTPTPTIILTPTPTPTIAIATPTPILPVITRIVPDIIFPGTRVTMYGNNFLPGSAPVSQFFIRLFHDDGGSYLLAGFSPDIINSTDWKQAVISFTIPQDVPLPQSGQLTVYNGNFSSWPNRFIIHPLITPTPTPTPTPTLEPTPTPLPTIPVPTNSPTPTIQPTPTPIVLNHPPQILTTSLPVGYLNTQYSAKVEALDQDPNDDLAMNFSGLPQGFKKGKCYKPVSLYHLLTGQTPNKIVCSLEGKAISKAGAYGVKISVIDKKGGQDMKILQLRLLPRRTFLFGLF